MASHNWTSLRHTSCFSWWISGLFLGMRLRSYTGYIRYKPKRKRGQAQFTIPPVGYLGHFKLLIEGRSHYRLKARHPSAHRYRLIAHTCIEATVRFAAELGYEVTVVRDATADYSDEEMHAALDVNIQNYASAIVSTEEIVASISALKIETGSGLPRRILAAKAALVQQVCPSKGGSSFFR